MLLNGVRGSVDLQVDYETPVLPVLLLPVPVPVVLPINDAIVTKEATEVLVGRVSFQPTPKQVQVVKAVVLDVVQPRVVVVKVAISITDHDEKIVEVFHLLGPIVAEAVCKVASVLVSMTSYRGVEVVDDENDFPKMVKVLPEVLREDDPKNEG